VQKIIIRTCGIIAALTLPTLVAVAFGAPANAAIDGRYRSGHTSGNGWVGNVELAGTVTCDDAPSTGATILWTLTNIGDSTISIDHAVASPTPEVYDGTFGPTLLASDESAISAEMVDGPGTYELTAYGKAPGNSATASVVVSCDIPPATTSASASASESESATPDTSASASASESPLVVETGGLPVTGMPVGLIFIIGASMVIAGVVGIAFSRARRRHMNSRAI
jgi:hypothetical protein